MTIFKTKFISRLDSLGEEKVRENLSLNLYGREKKALAEEWLRKKTEKK